MEILARNSIIQIKDGWTYRKETQKSKHLDLNYAERSLIVLTNSLHGLAFGLLANRKFSNNTDGLLHQYKPKSHCTQFGLLFSVLF